MKIFAVNSPKKPSKIQAWFQTKNIHDPDITARKSKLDLELLGLSVPNSPNRPNLSNSGRKRGKKNFKKRQKNHSKSNS